MKKMVTVLIVVGMVVMSISTSFAAGMPQAHGTNGRTFGSLVSGLARTSPQTLVSHVSGR